MLRLTETQKKNLQDSLWLMNTSSTNADELPMKIVYLADIVNSLVTIVLKEDNAD